MRPSELFQRNCWVSFEPVEGSITGWAEQKVIRESMLFLRNSGVGTSRAVRVYKTSGADAVRLISENPAASPATFAASASSSPTGSR